MPKYSITRKYNLGNFENIDLGVTDCETMEEAITEMVKFKKTLLEKPKEVPYKNSLDEEDIQVKTIPF